MLNSTQRSCPLLAPWLPAAPPCGPQPPRATPLLKGSSLFSRMSLASVPSSIRSSLVMTPMVRRPERAQRSKALQGRSPRPPRVQLGAPTSRPCDLEQAIMSPAWTLVSLMLTKDSNSTNHRVLAMRINPAYGKCSVSKRWPLSPSFT